MSKAEKLLNLMMNEAASDGEILNARRMLIKELKSINQQLNIGSNSYSNTSYAKTYEKEYLEMKRKYNVLHSDYQELFERYKNFLNDQLNKKIEKTEHDMHIQDQIIKILVTIGEFLGLVMLVCFMFEVIK